MSSKVSHRGGAIAAAAVAVFAITAGVATAAKPKAGDYRYERCIPAGPCPVESVSFAVKDGSPSKVKGFTYINGFTCGVLEVKRSIKVKPSGKFKYSGPATAPTGKVPVTMEGRFTARKKAEGSLVIKDDCASEPVDFAAEYEGSSGGDKGRRAGTWTMSVSFPSRNTGTGTVTGTGIDCPGDCSETFPVGTGVTLTAIPDPGSTFTTWSNACEGLGDPSCRVSGPENSTVFASPNFVSSGPGPGPSVPDTTISKAPKKKVKTKGSKATVEFEFGSPASGATFECRLDDKAYKACESPKRLKAKLGKHTFDVRALNAGGDPDTTPATARFKVVKK